MPLNIQNGVSFTGRDTFINGLKKPLNKEEQIKEQMRAITAGMSAKVKGVEECKKIIIQETLCGNFDFLKAFNKAIGDDMAKKAYSLIGKK